MSVYQVNVAGPFNVIALIMRAPFQRHRSVLGLHVYTYEVEAESSSAAVDQVLDVLADNAISPHGIACSARLVTP